MGNPSLRKTRGTAAIAVSGGVVNNRCRAHAAALLLLLCGVVSLSGCIGLTSAQLQAKQSKAPTSTSLSVSPGAVNFGTVAIGGTVSQSVTVSNPTGSPISVTQASTVASGITIPGAALPMVIGPGQQSILNIVFSPKSRGAITGNVSVMSSASSAPSTVSISGTGVPAQALLNPSTSSLSFGNVPAGGAKVLGVELMNAGNSNVTISGVKVVGGKFTTSGVSAGLILAPGQSASLDVTFSALATGTLNGSVTVVSNAANSPAVINLSGAGTSSSSHSVALAWAPDPSAVAGYNVYRSTISGGPYSKVNSPDITTTIFTDSSVQNGQTYYYVVTALTSAGMESSPSTEVSAVIPAL